MIDTVFFDPERKKNERRIRDLSQSAFRFFGSNACGYLRRSFSSDSRIILPAIFSGLIS
jgi:hypothetical protein